jgi:transposase InsO family protein
VAIGVTTIGILDAGAKGRSTPSHLLLLRMMLLLIHPRISYAATISAGEPRCRRRDSRPSDHGAHYRWPGWLTRISDAKLVRSMSRKGCSQDNAACEGFFGRLKPELFYPRDWKTITIEQFVREINAYIRWHNEKRIKLPLAHATRSSTKRALA